MIWIPLVALFVLACYTQWLYMDRAKQYDWIDEIFEELSSEDESAGSGDPGSV